LWCEAEDANQRWRLQFDVRSTTQTNLAAHESTAESEGVIDETTWNACYRVIADVFGEDGREKPGGLAKQLVAALQLDRFDWPTSLLRRIWESLMAMKEGRRRSPAHEARWLNLLGFSLRPGYGLAVDDWRVAETWRHVRGKLTHAGASQVEALILWRRVSGGLSAGQQIALAEPLLASLRNAHAIGVRGKKIQGIAGVELHESSEAWRLLGSLELLNVPVKVQIGNMIVDLIERRKYEKVRNPMIWALGRLGQRQPLYGPLNTVVPEADAGKWCKALLDLDAPEPLHLALMQLARKTGDRYRDLDSALRDRVANWLSEIKAASHLIELVTKGGTLAEEERDQVFGEALPKGLRFR
jgi:hypothetical protein